MSEIQAYELFAGVGGFRVALKRAGIDVVWSNQWEPNETRQYASSVYEMRFPEATHSNENISDVVNREVNLSEEGNAQLPSANLLVGGFPCQDYSVAKSLTSSTGIEGKKGVLWWDLWRLAILKQVEYLLLENVDRLLSSPASQKGKDFAVMLRSLTSNGYTVEWRVINAADYGFPQKRKRIFILASKNPKVLDGVFERAFPGIPRQEFVHFNILETEIENSNLFGLGDKKSKFMTAGRCEGLEVTTWKHMPLAEDPVTLGSILQAADEVGEEFWIDDPGQIRKWKEHKSKKSLARKHKVTGFEYRYQEGSMPFPDALDKPSRTIVTGEGGSGPSRFKHVIMQGGRFRRLTPIELERLNGFDDNWTLSGQRIPELSPSRRAFLMGNALVIGVVSRLASELRKSHEAQ